MRVKEILEKGPLPCPFCGKTDVSVKTASVDLNFENPTMQVFSYCNHCGTKSPHTKVISSLTPSDVVTAIGYELWNKRVNNVN